MAVELQIGIVWKGEYGLLFALISRWTVHTISPNMNFFDAGYSVSWMDTLFEGVQMFCFVATSLFGKLKRSINTKEYFASFWSLNNLKNVIELFALQTFVDVTKF